MIFCHTCGASNDSSQNYCLNDGTKLQKETTIKLTKQSASFCPSCGTKADTNNNYCYACGTSFYTKKEGGTGIVDVIKPTAGQVAGAAAGLSGGKLAVGTVAKAAIGAVGAFILLFILTTLIGNSLIDTMMEEMLDEAGFGEAFIFSTILSGIDIFSTSSMVLFHHLVPLKFSVDMSIFGEDGTGAIKLAFSFLSYLLVPVIISLVVGVVLGKFFIRRDERLKTSVVYGVVYAVLLAIVSLFVGESFDAGNGIGFSAEYSYSFFGAILNGFVVSFLFVWAGMKLVHWFSGKREGDSIYSVSASKALTGALTALAVAVICAFIGISNADHGSFLADLEDEGIKMKTPLSVQAGVYLFGLSNFGEFKSEYKEPRDGATGLTYSLIGGPKSDGDNVSYGILNGLDEEDLIKIIIAAWSLAILLIAFFIWTGMQFGKKFGFQVPQLLIFSALYAILSALIQSAGSMGMHMKVAHESVEMFLGMGSISTFFTSFLFAALFTILGGWFQKRRA